MAADPQTTMLSLREGLAEFVLESLRIEGITRLPTLAELEATEEMLIDDDLMGGVMRLQPVYAPGKPLRNKRGMNVRVGSHVAPQGDPRIAQDLAEVLRIDDPWQCHVAFETLHPFMDGNGRAGRAVWAWKMIRSGRDPFALPFLHRFYYQTLEHADGR
jgi:hypothetical protein